jgi:hypothetical protein
MGTLQAPSPTNATTARRGAPGILEGEDVRQNLAGMLFVRQRVHGRHPGVGREFDHVVLRIRPDHRAVNHPAEHPCRVLDGLATPQLDVLRVEKQRTPAQFVNPHLETHPGPGR